MTRRHSLLALAVLPVLSAGCSGAPPVPPPPPRVAPAPAAAEVTIPPVVGARIPLSLTVSGGVSLGSYQAGFLYYLAETLSRPENADVVDVPLVTGASAGNVNGLLFLFSLCAGPEGGPVDAPEDSPFFRIWVPVGEKELFRTKSAEERNDAAARLGAFSTKGLLDAVERLRTDWFSSVTQAKPRWIWRGCDKVFGVSTTRERPIPSPVQGQMTLPRQEEKFVLRLTADKGGRPRLTNYAYGGGASHPLLPFPTDQSTHPAQEAAFAYLSRLLLASAAFPVAFPPAHLPHCLTRPGRTETTGENACSELDLRKDDPFIDGGVFDNTPLRLAHRIDGQCMADDGSWLPANRCGRSRRSEPGEAAPVASTAAPGAAASAGSPPAALPARPSPSSARAIRYLFVDPHNATYPEDPGERDGGRVTSALPFVSELVANFVDTAMTKELATLVAEQPDLRARLLLSARQLPTASGHLANFFGFFDSEIRVFDYYLGMADARRFVEASIDPLVAQAFPGRRIVHPKGAMDDQSASWAPFHCLEAVVSGRDQAACARTSMPFRILLQTAVDRLASRCFAVREDPESRRIPNKTCQDALDEKRPRVLGVRDAGSEWKQKPGEDPFRHQMRLLDAYGFPFRDLLGDRGDKKPRPGEAMVALRAELGRIVQGFADRQPWPESWVVAAVGKAGLNFLQYAPPEAIGYGVFGRMIEGGMSFHLGSGFRFSAALQFQGFESLASPEKNVFAFTPLVGLEVEPSVLTGPVLQTRFLARGGFQQSTVDFLPYQHCDTAQFASKAIVCSAFVVQGGMTLSVFERLRGQIVYEGIPTSAGSPRPYAWSLLYGIGLQTISPF